MAISGFLELINIMPGFSPDLMDRDRGDGERFYPLPPPTPLSDSVGGICASGFLLFEISVLPLFISTNAAVTPAYKLQGLAGMEIKSIRLEGGGADLVSTVRWDWNETDTRPKSEAMGTKLASN